MHKAYEDNFWATKMGLAGCSPEALASSKTAYDTFLSDATNLKAVRSVLQQPTLTDEQKKARTHVGVFWCNIVEYHRCSPSWKRPLAATSPKTPLQPSSRWALCCQHTVYNTNQQEKLNSLEASLAAARNTMQLGYTDPDSGEFVKASSVQLRDKMRTSDDQRMRKVTVVGCVFVMCIGFCDVY